ncbi:hypothetical protein [Butyrivibrio sp. FC2001]|uniref:hypothetical protein n=1 Tax=Butyrivibrio sp. FC2001 TaxID=1280671 RepID=UPI00041B498B|nr:hypothetical protein [Butyrivibrio sp. FC2001]
MFDLITAHKARAHVTSEDEAARIRGLMGADNDFVVFGNGMDITFDSMKITIGTGEGFMNGRYFRLTEPVELQLGEFEKANTYRRDSIVLELLENVETGEEHAEFVVVKGAEYSSKSACIKNEMPTESGNDKEKLLGCFLFYDAVFSSTTLYSGTANIVFIKGVVWAEDSILKLQMKTNVTDGMVSNLQKSFQDGCKKIAKACTDKGVSTADNASPDTIATNIGKVFQKGKESFHTTYGGSGYEFDTNGTITIPVKYCSYFKITLNEIGASFCTIECGAMKKTLSKAGESFSFAPVDFNSSYLKIAAGGASGKVKGKYDVQYSI